MKPRAAHQCTAGTALLHRRAGAPTQGSALAAAVPLAAVAAGFWWWWKRAAS